MRLGTRARGTNRVGIAALLLPMLPMLPGAPAGAATRTFPGCGATLKKCIENVPAGSKIVLKTNNKVIIPAGGLDFTKNLSLVAAKGFKPKLGPATGIAYVNWSHSADDGRITVKGIHFVQSAFAAQFSGTAVGGEVVFKNNEIDFDTGSNGDHGISIYYSDDSRGSMIIRNNHINSSGNGIDVRMQGGRNFIVGNTTTAPNLIDSAGGIFAGAAAGSPKATVANNVVHDVAGCGCGSPAGMYILVNDTPQYDVDVLNNTIVRVGDNFSGGNNAVGLQVSSPTSVGASMNVRLYNNDVVESWTGMQVDQPHDDYTVAGGGNNTFDIGEGGDVTRPEDVGTITHHDPMFVDEAGSNFRLQSTSKLRDKGKTCIESTPIPRSDAARRFRVSGGGVDVGAYEFGSKLAGSVGGISRSGNDSASTVFGTKGVDVICGLGGGDDLVGRKGNDFIFGGDGPDLVAGDEGNDRLWGQAGNDQGFGEAGRDHVNMKDGVQGNDSAHGGMGDDTCTTDPQDERQSC